VPARLIHVSDLHVGAREEPRVEGPLRALIDALRPDVIVATGDLTHQGRRSQHEHASAFLRGLGPPVLAVPGNHDIPWLFRGRLAHPWREFERQWSTTEPVFSTEGLCVVGLNSVRPWRHQSGGTSGSALQQAASRLGLAPAGALRAVALHHQLTGAPWRTRKRPVARRGHVLAALVEAGAELILGGHIHQSAVSERREFQVTADGAAGAVLSTAPGLGRPRPRRRREARGLAVCEAEEAELRVDTYLWRDGAFVLTASRRYPRGTSTLSSRF
jgi:3',5'-cyclic AMP phosphodiesterase CpdA